MFRPKMREGGSTLAAVAVLFFVYTSYVLGATVPSQEPEQRRVPLYIRKARLYAERRKAYEQTMEMRMKAMAQSSTTFATQLYLHHVNGSHGNVLISPLSAYVSLAMTLTASQGMTKREVLGGLALKGEGRGIHTSLQRALTSLRDDDKDDVNDEIYGLDVSGGEGEEEAGLDLSQKELEDIIKNDYIIDNSISYNTGQTQIRYSSGVKTNKMQSDSPEPDLSIRLANGMFHSEEVALSQHFFNRLVSLYGAPPMAIQANDPDGSVNLWVDAATRGAVPAMLAPDAISAETLFVLVSAFSFRGAWKENFDEKETAPMDFVTEKGDTVLAPFMYRAGNYSVKVVEQVGVKVLELPYANDRYSLYVLLPSPGVGLQEVEGVLETQDVLGLLQDMPQPAITILMLPEFRLSSRSSLESELKALGVNRLFTERQADLRRMTGEEASLLYVTDFLHYAALQVDEGTSSDSQKQSVEIGSDLDPDHIKSSPNGEHSNTSVHALQSAHEDNIDDVMMRDDDSVDTDDDEYDYEEYDDYYDNDESVDSSEYFIANRPFCFVVKDKQYNLILLMGRVTNPLP